MKRILKVTLTLLGTWMFLASGLIAMLSLRLAPPFYLAYAESASQEIPF